MLPGKLSFAKVFESPAMSDASALHLITGLLISFTQSNGVRSKQRVSSSSFYAKIQCRLETTNGWKRFMRIGGFDTVDSSTVQPANAITPAKRMTDLPRCYNGPI